MADRKTHEARQYLPVSIPWTDAEDFILGGSIGHGSSIVDVHRSDSPFFAPIRFLNVPVGSNAIELALKRMCTGELQASLSQPGGRTKIEKGV
jgi:hypothetical protein